MCVLIRLCNKFYYKSQSEITMHQAQIQFLILSISLLFENNFGCYHQEPSRMICSNISSTQIISNFPISKVEWLEIVESNITILSPSTFTKFSNLTDLYLKSLHIKVIKAGAFNGLDKLEYLMLDNNELTELPKGVYSSLHKLKFLSLSHNRIYQVQEFSLRGLDNLRKLYLENNTLFEVEDIIRNLKHLVNIDLSGNPLLEFDYDDLPKNLSILDLSRCDIKSLNLTFPISQLKKVWMDHNQLEYLDTPVFGKSKQIEFMTFSNNQISSIDKNFFHGLHILNHLNLAHNQISKIDTHLFRDLHSLKYLDLSYNKIEEFFFGTFDSLTQLVFLDISNNKLKALHQNSFNSMSNLRELCFENNQISSISVQELLRHLTELNKVWLNPNPWNCDDLVYICEEFSKNDVDLAGTFSDDVENVQGIACTSHQNEYEDVLEDSKMKSFFNEDFEKSKFFQFFQKKLYDSKLKMINSSVEVPSQ